jgi:hypothetical protein
MPESPGKKLVASCGLYCGDCPFHKGDVADLARDLRKKLREYRFDKTAEAIPFKAFDAYPACYETLGAMVKLRCRRGCRAGGPPCSIKDCAERRRFAGCWECDDFASCSKLEKRLAVAHGAAYLYNLRKLKRDGVDAFLAGPRKWYAK